METTAIQEENEKKKEYLKSYRRAVKREQDILEEIQRLRLDKMFPSVVNDGMPHGSSHSDLSDYIAIMDEQIELLKKERLKKVRCYQKIERQIRQMENEDEQEVLRLRYIKGLKWEEVALKMSYSYRRTLDIHGKALLSFEM
jgi:hypothetical protein